MSDKPYEKGQIVELTIDDMGNEGQGIGRLGDEGIVVFVNGALYGDKVKAQLTKVKKNYAIGKLVEVVEKSPKATEAFACEYIDKCGGCGLGELEYDSQLELKAKQVKSKMERLAGVVFTPEGEEGPTFAEIAGMEGEMIYRYRNKATMPISTGGLITRKGGIQEPVHEPRIGFYPRKSHDVINCMDCWLQAEPAMAAAEATRQFMIEDHITSYDKRWEKGLMKAMTVRTAFGTGEVMVTYDINGKGIPNVSKLLEMLDDAIFHTGCSLESVHTRITKSSGKRETSLVAGKETITDITEIHGRQLHFEISPDSFYQVNPMQMQKLYGIIREYCKVAEGRNILDLYCGIGSIGLAVADLAENIVGIEIVPQAIANANRNAVINGIVNARYICGKAEEIIPNCMNGDAGKVDEEVVETIKNADLAILDPPRAGCKQELLDAIGQASVDSIVYVSCDPATLARDVKILMEKGYKVVECTPVDMFVNTVHVETVVLMSKVQK